MTGVKNRCNCRGICNKKWVCAGRRILQVSVKVGMPKTQEFVPIRKTRHGWSVGQHKTYQDPSVVSIKPANPTSKDLFTRPADNRTD